MGLICVCDVINMRVHARMLHDMLDQHVACARAHRQKCIRICVKVDSCVADTYSI
jgi:hypothetical protein